MSDPLKKSPIWASRVHRGIVNWDIMVLINFASDDKTLRLGCFLVVAPRVWTQVL